MDVACGPDDSERTTETDKTIQLLQAQCHYYSIEIVKDKHINIPNIVASMPSSCSQDGHLQLQQLDNVPISQSAGSNR